MDARAVAVAAYAAAALFLLQRARRRHPLRRVIAAEDVAAQATALREHRFARVRLPPPHAALARQLLSAAANFFDDAASTRTAHIPPTQRRDHDGRTGYVWERGREFLEVHPRSATAPPPPPAARAATAAMLESSAAFSAACFAHCEAVVGELARTSPPLALLARAEREAVDAAAAAAAPLTYSASMLRTHRYTKEDGADYPPHSDLGLLTLAPRASVPGLEIEASPGVWVAIEEFMAEDEALLFGGSTLEELCGVTALPHRVVRQGVTRLSAPYFLRASPTVVLPAAMDDDAAAAADGETVSVRAFVAKKIDERRQRNGELPQPAAPNTNWKRPEAATPPPAAPVAVAMPAVIEGASGEPVAVATPVEAAAPTKPTAPARVKACFRRLDADGDGRLTLEEVRAGLLTEHGGALPPHALERLSMCWDELAVGDLSFGGGLYVDAVRFNAIFAEVLFARHDADADGVLSVGEAQAALQFLVKRGGAAVAVACPPGEEGVPRGWFGGLYASMSVT